MNSLLYIDLTENLNFTYEKDIISQFKTIDPKLISFDIDYQSDSGLIENAKRLIKESSKSIIVVESDSTNASKISPFAEVFIEQPKKYLIFLDGENQWLEKLCSGIDIQYLKKNLSLEEKIAHYKNFIKSQD